MNKLQDSFNNTYLDPSVKYLYDINKQVNEWYQGFLFSKENINCVQYLNERGLDNETIKYFHLGFAPKDASLIYRMCTNADNMFGSEYNKE
jgi:DNA primase